ncbi:MAG: hypothetical protein EHM64_02615 [Ignavibacteriae bacterium]|nr:MAG: hypothetical protein EHM64_02615 [Ignavibacteriota bacterium]
MLHRHRHIVISLLLFSYVLLGVAGYLETLTVTGFGTNPQHISKPAGSHSSTFTVSYSQYKHIPSTVKISVPSPAVFTPPELPRISLYGIAFTQGETGILPDPIFPFYTSRAPPQS